MITQKSAERKLVKLIAAEDLIHQTWCGEKFEVVKIASPTEKGNLAENFLAELIKSLGYSDVEVIPGRRGHYDVGVGRGSRKKKLEVKLATQDTNENFQFNGIRYDTDYTHLFCLGVMRSSIRYLMIPKKWLTTKRAQYHLVSMTKGANATFKLTRSVGEMSDFGSFEADIQRYMGKPK